MESINLGIFKSLKRLLPDWTDEQIEDKVKELEQNINDRYSKYIKNLFSQFSTVNDIKNPYTEPAKEDLENIKKDFLQRTIDNKNIL